MDCSYNNNNNKEESSGRLISIGFKTRSSRQRPTYDITCTCPEGFMECSVAAEHRLA
jgi:hypothetical protein